MTRRQKWRDPGLARVRSVVAGLALAGTVSLEAVARHLGTSPRTLQRRLNQHGISFWALLEHSRFEIAAALLRETDLQVQEISARLGYRTPSGFARAFTNWSGASPTAFRTLSTRQQQLGARMARNGQKESR
jgi:AraC-like DNA-binding protein